MDEDIREIKWVTQDTKMVCQNSKNDCSIQINVICIKIKMEKWWAKLKLKELGLATNSKIPQKNDIKVNKKKANSYQFIVKAP